MQFLYIQLKYFCKNLLCYIFIFLAHLKSHWQYAWVLNNFIQTVLNLSPNNKKGNYLNFMTDTCFSTHIFFTILNKKIKPNNKFAYLLIIHI